MLLMYKSWKKLILEASFEYQYKPVQFFRLMFPIAHQYRLLCLCLWCFFFWMESSPKNSKQSNH
uniref:Uncharacterized protein n=1 Tax=Aegilops tauschii subsp. strangulata TaxID=200361 RepID=A0A453EPW9_AEGTS